MARVVRIRSAVTVAVAVALVGLLLTQVGAGRRAGAEVGSWTGGRALYAGLIFHAGPVAEELFPESARLFAQSRTEATARVEGRLMNRISKLRPGFFRGFASDIQSGDHVRISQALARGSKILVRAASKEFDFDPAQMGELQDARRGPHVLDDWNSHVYLSYQLYEQTAVYYYHEQVVFVWMFLNEAIDIKRGQSQLAREILIDRIATELAI